MKTQTLHFHTKSLSELYRVPYSSIFRSSLRLFEPRLVTRHQLFSPTHTPRRFSRIFVISSSKVPFHLPTCSESDKNDANSTQSYIPLPSGGQLLKNATLIGLATLASKILGLVREIIIASTFGIGPVATAFKYASLLPGFVTSVLGGVNGPIHITMATMLRLFLLHHYSYHIKLEPVFKLTAETIPAYKNGHVTGMLMVGGIVAALVFIFAEHIIHIYAPGLWIMAEGQTTREIATKQLRSMIPCMILAGPVGLGFGYMSAEASNVLPAISPAFSSMLLIASCVFYTSVGRSSALSSGGILLSSGASLGIFLQWIVQVIMLKERWDSVLDSRIGVVKNVDVCEFFSLLLPATISLGLRQIASFTDLCFASLVPGAAAGLSYANLLVMAPLGLFSSVIVLPLLPTFSKLAKSGSWHNLAETLKRAVLLSMVITLPILSIACILADPIIRLLFERYTFDSSARALVSDLFILYSLGSPFFILRELLVLVFYASGDGNGPFLVSAVAITLNALLDWLFVSRYNLGAGGLALSTSFTTALSVIMMFHLLHRRLPVIGFAELFCPFLLLSLCCIISSFTTFMSYKMVSKMFSFTLSERFFWIKDLFSMCLSGALGISSFFFPIVCLDLSGSKLARDFTKTLME